jgi:hypothetical protein
LAALPAAIAIPPFPALPLPLVLPDPPLATPPFIAIPPLPPFWLPTPLPPLATEADPIAVPPLPPLAPQNQLAAVPSSPYPPFTLALLLDVPPLTPLPFAVARTTFSSITRAEALGGASISSITIG